MCAIRVRCTLWRSGLASIMPIVGQMYQVLYAGKEPADAVRDLMLRSVSLKPAKIDNDKLV